MKKLDLTQFSRYEETLHSYVFTSQNFCNCDHSPSKTGKKFVKILPEKIEYLEDDILGRRHEKSLLSRKPTLLPSVGGEGK